MSNPTLEEMQHICEAEYGSDMIREWPWVQRSLERLSVMLETQERCEERMREGMEWGMRYAYSWARNETSTGPEAFERFVANVMQRNKPEILDSSSDPQPTPEAVAAFNERQLEFRRIYLMGYAEVLPEHRAEGVVKAAERFPLKRLVEAKGVGFIDGMRADCDPCGMIFFTKGDGSRFYLTTSGVRAAISLLDTIPRVEDVPIEEEEEE